MILQIDPSYYQLYSPQKNSYIFSIAFSVSLVWLDFLLFHFELRHTKTQSGHSDYIFINPIAGLSCWNEFHTSIPRLLQFCFSLYLPRPLTLLNKLNMFYYQIPASQGCLKSFLSLQYHSHLHSY